MHKWSQALLAAFALTVLAPSCAYTAELGFGIIDNTQSQYLSSGGIDKLALTPEGASCIEASLLGLPCLQGGAKASAQAESVLKSDIFTRPTAVLALQLAGPVIGIKSMAGGRTAHQLDVAPGTSALAMSASLASLSAETPASMNVYRADYATLPGCSDACMEALLQEALLAIGGNYTAGSGGPMRGVARVWQTQEAGSKAAELHLQELPVRLWAAEIAVLHHTASEMAAEYSRRQAQRSQLASGPWLLEGTLVGLQALSQRSPAETAGAATAVESTVRQAQDILSRPFDARVATTIAMLGEVPTATEGLQGLLQWRAGGQRSSVANLLSGVGGTLPSGGRPSLNWQTDAAAWLSFIIIVAFLAAGIHCLTNMQFKKDSLLYGRARAD